jgi:patatin-like phospholipase/acyl hydrolase
MKTVLSIDGGGIRGLIPALVLAEIEKQTGRPIAECFDLMAGTSTGGILALGLARDDGNGKPRYTAKDLADLYVKRGREIFSRSLWKGISSVGSFLDEKYSHGPLDGVLTEYFGEEPMGAALTRVMTTAYDIGARTPSFFKSWREEWRSVEMRHAGRATSAAPTYFEPARIRVGAQEQALIDGGVFINNPAMSAYAEARRLFPRDKIFVLSLGTGELVRPIEYDEAKDWGLAGWMLPVLSCMFDGVSDAVDYQLRQILDESYVRMQTSLTIASDDMDDATAGNMANLKAEARKLLRTQKAELERVASLLGG